MPAPRRYVALLRALNVGGHGVVTMADLRAAFEAFGATEVETVIQSGNVLFTTGARDPSRLARAIEAHLADATGHATTAFVRTRDELQRAAARNPFAAEARAGTHRSHLMFLSEAPTVARRAALMELQRDDYALHVDGAVLYYAYARSLEGKRRTIDFERVLGVRGTARAANVVDTLIARLGAAPGAPPAKAKAKATAKRKAKPKAKTAKRTGARAAKPRSVTTGSTRRR